MLTHISCFLSTSIMIAETRKKKIFAYRSYVTAQNIFRIQNNVIHIRDFVKACLENSMSRFL